MQNRSNDRCIYGGLRDVAEIVGVVTVSSRPWAQEKLDLKSRASDNQSKGNYVHEKQGGSTLVRFSEHCEDEHEKATCANLSREDDGEFDVLGLGLVDIAKSSVNSSATCNQKGNSLVLIVEIGAGSVHFKRYP